MYIKVIPSTSAYNALRYIHKPGSERIATNLVGNSPSQLAMEMRLHNTLGPMIKHEVIHIPMSAARGELLAAEQWMKAAQKVMKDLGYAGCPFDLVRHSDKESDHAHLVVSPIAPDGSRVDRRGDHYKAERVGREIERELGLIQIEGLSRQKERKSIERELGVTNLIQLAEQIEQPEKTGPNGEGLQATLERAIRAALKDSKTFSDLAWNLLSSGVRIEASVSKTGKVIGLGYRLYGEQGGYLQASKVHESFSFTKLQKKHGISFDDARDLPRLKPGAIVPLDDIQKFLAGTRNSSSDHVNQAVRNLSRHLMFAMRRSANANAPYTQSRGADTSRAYRSTAIRLYRAGLGGQLFAGESTGSIGSFLRSRRPLPVSVAAPDRGASAAESTNPSDSLGDGIWTPAQGLERAVTADQGEGIFHGAPAHDGPRPHLDVSGPIASRPTGGGSHGTTGASLPAAPGDHPGGGSGVRLGPASPGQVARGVANATGGPYGPGRTEASPAGGTGANRLGGLGGPRGGRGVFDEGEETVATNRRLQIGSGDPEGLEPEVRVVTAPWGTVIEFERAHPREFGLMVVAVEDDARAVDPDIEDHNLVALEVVEQGYPCCATSPEEKSRGPIERVRAFVRRAMEVLENLGKIVREALTQNEPSLVEEVSPESLMVWSDDELADQKSKMARIHREQADRDAQLMTDYRSRIKPQDPEPVQQGPTQQPDRTRRR